MARACIRYTSGLRSPSLTAPQAQHRVRSPRGPRDPELPPALRRFFATPSSRSGTATFASSLESGRNSCSGGSSRRTVTGRPSIARKMPSKSSFCMRFELGEGLRGGVFALREDHLAHDLQPLALHEHVLRAAQPDALGPELPGPAARPPACRRWPSRRGRAASSAHGSTVSKSSLVSGATSGTSPAMTRPLLPSMVRTSPASKVSPSTSTVRAVDLEGVAAGDGGLAHARGRRPPRGSSCRPGR